MYDWVPFNNEQLNLASGSYTPSTIRPYNNAAFSYWARSLYQRLASTIEYELPDEWSGNVRAFFEWCIYACGYVAVFQDDKFGDSFQPCTVYGRDLYYQPTEVIIANPRLNVRLKIGEECELLQITPDYRGVIDIVIYYAEKLALLDNAINVSLVNSKVSWILGAKTKSAAAALKKILDKVNRGDPAVIYDQRITNDPNDHDTPFQFLERGRSPRDYYLTPDQLQDMQTIINSFDAEIGIPTVPYQKAERMVNAEAQSKAIDAKARCETWVDMFNSSAERVLDVTGIKCGAKIRYEGGDPDGNDTGDDQRLQSAEVL